MADDIATWADWLSWVNDRVSEWLIPLAGLVGIGVLIALQIADRRKPSVPHFVPPRAAPTAHTRPPSLTKVLMEAADRELRRKVTAELVTMIDERSRLSPDVLMEPEYGPYTIWLEKADEFLEAVFGPLERQRFRENYDPPPRDRREALEHRIRRLADLRDHPERWELQVDEAGLEAAAEARRARDEAEQIVDATLPRQAESNPYTRAAEMQRGWEARQLRKALHSVAEDELEGLNRPRLVAFIGGVRGTFSPATAQWSEHGEWLKQHAPPQVYQAGAAAYAALRDLGAEIEAKGPQSVMVNALADDAERKLDLAVKAMREAQP